MAFRYAGPPVDTFQIAVLPPGPGATVPPISSTSDSGTPSDTASAYGGPAAAAGTAGATARTVARVRARSGRIDRNVASGGAVFTVLSESKRRRHDEVNGSAGIASCGSAERSLRSCPLAGRDLGEQLGQLIPRHGEVVVLP